MTRPARLLGVTLIALLGALGVLAVLGFVLGSLLVPVSHVTISGGAFSGPTTWAFPGVAFRPAVARADATGWRVAAVLVSKSQTVVVSVTTNPKHKQVAVANGRSTVTLSDSGGHFYPWQSNGVAPPVILAGGGQNEAFAVFGPLRPGTTMVLMRHTVPGGGTTRVPINLARLAAVPPPLPLNLTRRSGTVRVTLTAVRRGALLSEIDLQARGFTDPGGEVTQVRNGNTVSEMGRPPQSPVTVTLHTATGALPAPMVGLDGVHGGVVPLSLGFTAPPSGTLVTLTIVDFELLDLPPARRTTHGRWSFTFRMP